MSPGLRVCFGEAGDYARHDKTRRERGDLACSDRHPLPGSIRVETLPGVLLLGTLSPGDTNGANAETAQLLLVSLLTLGLPSILPIVALTRCCSEVFSLASALIPCSYKGNSERCLPAFAYASARQATTLDMTKRVGSDGHPAGQHQSFAAGMPQRTGWKARAPVKLSLP